ncbi:low-density lipoprotein receptor-related protein 11 isoform X2 [Rhineura floridana]|uniref:low-density lipoprotein receptor-related protein 11 isoform X2 n=1 Tax=Rhineura floridana TaxID=261503 RepID=UPI002AC7E87F|nr:low-density lipoprotein receptor-related protein 11 isoform X2 [Rhineura floridana]
MAAQVPGPPGHHCLRRLLLLPLLLLVMLGSPSVQLRSPAMSGVESLLEEFRRQLQQEQNPPAGGHGNERTEAAGRCRGGNEEPAGDGGGRSFFSARPDAIIRTKDSIAAGATFLDSPGSVASPRLCLDACCAEAHCTLVVVQQQQQAGSFRCYLFNCTYRGRAVCLFSPQRGYSSYSLEPSSYPPASETDEPPLSKAGKDIMLQLPVNWVILDGRESIDDHGIIQYEWTLLQGAPSVDMKVPQPGTLKLSHLQEGKYILQLTVTDTAGQKSSDNVSVTVLPMDHSMLVTSGQNTITHPAISSIQQNAIGQTQDINKALSFEITQKTIVSNQAPDADKLNQSSSQGPKKQTTELMPELCLVPPAAGPCNGHFPRWHFDAFSGTCIHFIYGGCKGNENNFLQESDCLAECVKVHDSKTSGKDRDYENDIAVLKGTPIGKGHPVPEAGAVLPLALGLAITALLLLMVACRLRLVRQKLKKARPLMSEESDYLINGMYL